MRLTVEIKDIISVQNVLTGPGKHTAIYPTGTGRSFPGLKWPGREANRLLHLVPVLKNVAVAVSAYMLYSMDSDVTFCSFIIAYRPKLSHDICHILVL